MPATSKRKSTKAVTLTVEEARGVLLAAQALDAPGGDFARPGPATTSANLAAMVDRLGVVQVDTISVVARTQYLTLWSRLGAYPQRLLGEALYPRRDTFEYWSHAASIAPMADYPYYRAKMMRAAQQHHWSDVEQWAQQHPEVIHATLQAIHDRGPMASADFENPSGARKTQPWEWYGPKESRVALDVLWTRGDLMIHSRRAGQKLYELRERVLAEAFGEAAPDDSALPTPHETLTHFVDRTVNALGVVTPSWLWDYFRLGVRDTPDHAHAEGRAQLARAKAVLAALAREGKVIPATIEGIAEPAYLAPARMADLKRLRDGANLTRTTLLSPFDSLIWHRARARALFGYEVSFEAYIVPEKRRYGYYCLAILHRGQLVGRLDPKFERKERRLIVRALHLEPGIEPEPDLLDGLAGALRDLAAFLGAQTISIEKADPAEAAPRLAERVA